MNACNQFAPLPPVLENHWWLNNSFYHRPFSRCLLSDETTLISSVLCRAFVSSAFGRSKLPDSWRCLQLLCPLPYRAWQLGSKSLTSLTFPSKRVIGLPVILTLISYYWLCLGLIFGLITTDWLWEWALAHSVSHNRLECQWSNGVTVLKYQLNVLFLLVPRKRCKSLINESCLV